MKNLNRALGMALKYRWSLVGSIGCSALVALMWGASLGAVYPFVEVVLHNKTLQQWAQQRTADANREIEAAEREIAKLQAPLASVAPAQQSALNTQIAARRSEIENLRKRISSTQRLLPWIERYAPNDPFRTLVWIVVFMFVGTVLRGIFLMGNMVLVARVGQRTMLDLQNQVFRNVLDMEMCEIGVKGTGDLISRIRGETGAIGTAITTLFGRTIREPMKMVACLVGAAWVNWRLLVFSMLVCPLAAALMLKLARSTKLANRRAMEESARLLNRLYQALTYLRVVKAFTMEGHERSRFRLVAGDVYRKGMKIAWYGALARINNELLGVTIVGLSVLAGGYLVLNHQTKLFGVTMSANPMDFGEIMLFFAFLVGISDPLRKMADVYNLIQSGAVAADRVFPLVDQRPAVHSPQQPRTLPADNLEIEFDQVSFAYQPDRPVLSNVSLRVPAGTSLAIIGPNGCGKSTLINLLPRFFDPQSGCVRIAGLDLRELSVRQLREQIGYVTQLTMLFNDSIAANISYGTPDASRLQIVDAARKAFADEFIQELQDGYDANIGEHGGKLSGGQRQRLSLARAILKDPKILILDEATSQIDPHSEQLIHKSLREFIRHRTTVIITHRLSTLELVDRILVMKDGQVVDCGTHQQLLARCSVYRQLRQLGMQEAA